MLIAELLYQLSKRTRIFRLCFALISLICLFNCCQIKDKEMFLGVDLFIDKLWRFDITKISLSSIRLSQKSKYTD